VPDNNHLLGGITPFVQGAVERVRTSGVLTPLLWLCGLSMPLSGVLAAVTSGALQILFATCFVVVPLITIGAYFIWLFRDPNRLQSEDYQYNLTRLRLLGDDRMTAPAEVIEHSPVSNTHVPDSRHA
jgi:hypothetical protein